jgi:hypothetical protein
MRLYDLIADISDRCLGDTAPIRDAAPSRGADSVSDIRLRSDEATGAAVIPLRTTAHGNCAVCATTGDETRAVDCAVRAEGRAWSTPGNPYGTAHAAD